MEEVVIYAAKTHGVKSIEAKMQSRKKVVFQKVSTFLGRYTQTFNKLHITNTKPLKMTEIKKRNVGSGIGIGAALGVAFGAIYGSKSGDMYKSIALGIAIGVAIGAIFDFAFRKKE